MVSRHSLTTNGLPQPRSASPCLCWADRHRPRSVGHSLFCQAPSILNLAHWLAGGWTPFVLERASLASHSVGFERNEIDSAPVARNEAGITCNRRREVLLSLPLRFSNISASGSSMLPQCLHHHHILASHLLLSPDGSKDGMEWLHPRFLLF